MKVVIDAYNGTMSFYVFDPADPMIRTYESMFPGMFLPRVAMPAALQPTCATPGLLQHAGEVFATYHVTNPTLLYNKGNQWQIPTDVSISGAGADEPLLHDHAAARSDPRGVRAHRAVRAQRPHQHDRLAGGRVGCAQLRQGDQLRVPSSLSVYGPAQVEAAVNQDPTISAQRTLWGQQGSR